MSRQDGNRPEVEFGGFKPPTSLVGGLKMLLKHYISILVHRIKYFAVHSIKNILFYYISLICTCTQKYEDFYIIVEWMGLLVGCYQQLHKKSCTVSWGA